MEFRLSCTCKSRLPGDVIGVLVTAKEGELIVFRNGSVAKPGVPSTRFLLDKGLFMKVI